MKIENYSKTSSNHSYPKAAAFAQTDLQVVLVQKRLVQCGSNGRSLLDFRQRDTWREIDCVWLSQNGRHRDWCCSLCLISSRQLVCDKRWVLHVFFYTHLKAPILTASLPNHPFQTTSNQIAPPTSNNFWTTHEGKKLQNTTETKFPTNLNSKHLPKTSNHFKTLLTILNILKPLQITSNNFRPFH